MKKQLIILISGVVLMLGLGVGAPVTASAQATNPQVCQGLDSGKIDVRGDKKFVTVTAPDGMLIDGYCVKAASTQQGSGPKYFEVDPPQKTVTFAHPSGKDISHYSVSYTTEPPPECPEGDMDPNTPGCQTPPECPDGDMDPNTPGCQAPPDPCDEVCPVPVQGSGPDLVCDGSFIGGTYTNVTVPAGRTCIVIDAYINGDVTSDGGRNVYILDSTVVGDIRLSNVSGDVAFGDKAGCRFDPHVGGSIVVKNSHNVLVCQATVCEDVKLVGNDGMVTIRDSAIADELVIRRTKKYTGPTAEEAGHRKPSAIRVLRVTAGTAIKLIDNHPKRKLIVRESSPTPIIR